MSEVMCKGCAQLGTACGKCSRCYDAAQVELAALREELDSAKRVGPPHFCGLPMSLNPHPEAGVPGRFLEIGTVSECIPCLVSSRHGWAKTAGYLQHRLAAAEQRNADCNAEIVAMVESALRRSFSLGQVYWQQADSDSTCQQNKSDQTMETQAQHILNVVKSIKALAQPTESGASE